MSDEKQKSAPTVFISYSHDTKDHKAWVADLGRQAKGEGNEGTEEHIKFVVAGKDTTEALEAAEESFDVIALAIERLVEFPGL